VINPYFPTNIHLLYEHFKIKVTAGDFSTKVGQEWYPYDSWEFLGNSIVACAAMVIGYIAFDPTDRKRAHHSAFFLVFATALMIMTARSRRMAEYWPPFAVIFCAFALQHWLHWTRSTLTRLSTDILDELQPFLDRPHRETDLHELWRTIALAVVAVSLGVVLFLNLRSTIKEIAGSEPHEYYRAGSQWMSANLKPGEMVFNTDWDDFPRLFYYNPANVYVSGLDPTYLYDKDKKLSALYDEITLGKEEDPGPLIRDRFGARYVFTDNQHEDFLDNAQTSGWFEIVYEDTQCTILHIRDQRVEPPPDDSETDDEGNTEPPPDNQPPKP
jgi:hypothetical protein